MSWMLERAREKQMPLQDLTKTPTLRSCIVAEEGYTFLSLDAVQIELKIVAYLSGDPLLIADANSKDMHLATAIRIFKDRIIAEAIELGSDTMKVLRYLAKQINFAVLYGAEAHRIAEMSDGSLTEEEAQELIDLYFATYTVLKAWIDSVKAQARKDGFVRSIFGRIRPLPEINGGSWKIREKAEREAVNTLVQGTAIDVVKQAMLYLRRLFAKGVRLVLQVHDEILWEVPDALLSLCLEQVKELKMAFPLYPFHIAVGKVYSDLVEIEEEVIAT